MSGRAYSRILGQHPILTKKGYFEKKRRPQKFITAYSDTSKILLQQNKILLIFNERGRV